MIDEFKKDFTLGFEGESFHQLNFKDRQLYLAEIEPGWMVTLRPFLDGDFYTELHRLQDGATPSKGVWFGQPVEHKTIPCDDLLAIKAVMHDMLNRAKEKA